MTKKPLQSKRAIIWTIKKEGKTMYKTLSISMIMATLGFASPSEASYPSFLSVEELKKMRFYETPPLETLECLADAVKEAEELPFQNSEPQFKDKPLPGVRLSWEKASIYLVAKKGGRVFAIAQKEDQERSGYFGEVAAKSIEESDSIGAHQIYQIVENAYLENCEKT